MKYSFFIIIISLIASCDLIPSKLRKAELAAKRYAWEVQAEDDEDIEAMYKAAEASCCGDETLNDEIQALNFYCRAAKNGHKASMIEVGHKFLNKGTGSDTIIPHDKALAFTFYSMAEQRGSDHAGYYRRQLIDELTQDEFARATRLVDSFPVVPCEITR